jgi:uncharacterized protein (TIGR02001 family)
MGRFAGSASARRCSGTLTCAALLAWAGAADAEEARAFVGATLTTDYVLDGLSQTRGDPALQPYLEVEFPSGLYVGAWLSNVDFGDGTDTIETDLYVGLRGRAGDLGFDVTLFQYFYDVTGYCCGELVAALDFPIFGAVSGSAAYHSFLDGNYAVEGGLGLALPYAFDVSGTYKTDSIGETWTIGLSRRLSDTLSADLRYHDASYADATTTFSLSWDTEWAALFGRR